MQFKNVNCHYDSAPASKVKLVYEFELPRNKRVALHNTIDAVSFVRAIWEEKGPQEAAYVVFLNNASEVLGYMDIGTGTIDALMIDIRVIIRGALELAATGFILAHSHVSGTALPSSSDVRVTFDLQNAGELFNLKLVDHLILDDENYHSLKEDKLF